MAVEPLVLAVDDEPGILRLIKLELSSQGFRVVTAENGEEGLRVANEERPDIALLDIVMPEMSGLEVMRRLRQQVTIPVILLTARGSDTDKVRGLELGADDYIAKPFSPEELTARVRAVLRRFASPALAENVVRSGDLEIDLGRRLVRRDGQVLSLTRTEWMLLEHLAANAGKIMWSAELLSRVWGPEYREDLQYLRVWISRLRRKLEPDPLQPRLIKTFQGIGYMLEVEDDSAEDESEEDAAEVKAGGDLPVSP